MKFDVWGCIPSEHLSFPVARYDSKEEAERMCDAMNSDGHGQFWYEEVEDDFT